jgi:hypothetical protein
LIHACPQDFSDKKETAKDGSVPGGTNIYLETAVTGVKPEGLVEGFVR